MSQEAWDRLVARNHPSTRDGTPQAVSLRRPRTTEKSQRRLGRPRFNRDGSLSFPTKGAPPPCPVGYAPVPGEPFRFTSKWEPCLDRTETLVMLKDGTMTVDAKCQSTEAPTTGLQVCPRTCAECPFKRQL